VIPPPPGEGSALARASLVLAVLGAALTAAALAGGLFLLVVGVIGCAAGFLLGLAALAGPAPRTLAAVATLLNLLVVGFWVAAALSVRD